ncbi:GtrA family protein [Haloarchaeobius iranensis]|uniref:Putative flippase GtrA (Transmembrane translocase of bactoprenol-linked glucose) n=1 Tax=Haloarchaeobius iranensis TaxID=996166 RepID=A0A1G9T3I4_9EURY|nr:GtrA family protein [Haloarchaeobius iranensis]SDM42196.1 Putative flippase GtrA (transmembrane translocase of bactoprenol-linked glucose) [Haloarchaeobius iranensis]
MSEDDSVAGPADSDDASVDTLGNRLSALVSGTRFGQFASVGAVGALFDVTTATALREFGIFPELAVFVGIEVSVLVMFLLNDNWTFSRQGHGGLVPTLRRLARSNLVRVGGITVQLLTFRLLYRVFFVEVAVVGLDGWFVVAKVTGIGVGMLVNYVAESLFTWRVHAE